MEDKMKKGLAILGLGLGAFLFLIIGLSFERVPFVISIVLALFTWIIHLDEKRNGNATPFGSVGIFVGVVSGFVSIALLISSFA